jgi:hypothetical protein
MNAYMSLLRSLRGLGDRMLYTSGSSGANQRRLIITDFNLHSPQLVEKKESAMAIFHFPMNIIWRSGNPNSVQDSQPPNQPSSGQMLE